MDNRLYIKNFKTGRFIQLGGATYKKLLKNLDVSNYNQIGGVIDDPDDIDMVLGDLISGDVKWIDEPEIQPYIMTIDDLNSAKANKEEFYYIPSNGYGALVMTKEDLAAPEKHLRLNHRFFEEGPKGEALISGDKTSKPTADRRVVLVKPGILQALQDIAARL